MEDFKSAVRALQILNRARLDDAIGTRWALLTVAGLNHTRNHHPRKTGQDLVLDKINWSAVLDLSAEGLAKLPQIARHADAWADEAARKSEAMQTFSSWYGFIGTTEQDILDEHIRTGTLAIHNARNVPLCSYQIYAELMESKTAAAFNSSLRAAGFSFRPLNQNTFMDIVYSIANDAFSNFNSLQHNAR